MVLARGDKRRAASALEAISGHENVSWSQCDVSNGNSLNTLCADIEKKHCRLDYAFNNGSSGGKGPPVATTKEGEWHKTVDSLLVIDGGYRA